MILKQLSRPTKRHCSHRGEATAVEARLTLDLCLGERAPFAFVDFLAKASNSTHDVLSDTA